MDAHDIAPCPLRLIAREVRAAQRVAGGGGGRRDGGDADAGGHRVKIPECQCGSRSIAKTSLTGLR